MEHSKAASATQQPPQLQKKKKSKNKKTKNSPGAAGELLAEADKANALEINTNGLVEQLARQLNINESGNKSTNNLNNTATHEKGRRGGGSKLVTNGNIEKDLSVSGSCCHVNGHDGSKNSSVALASVDSAECKSNGNQSTAEKQLSKKSKSKSNKLKNKECIKENCQEIHLVQMQKQSVEEMAPLTVQETLKQTFQNGSHVEEVRQEGPLRKQEAKDEVTLSGKEDENTNANVKDMQLNGGAAAQGEQKSSLTASTPATTATNTSEAHPAVKQDTVETVDETTAKPTLDLSNVQIEYKEYESELQMHDIMRLIQAELSEPYSIYTYRYFIYNWPKLCFLAAHGNEYVGAIVCKLDRHMNVKRGYIAMLAVRKEYRKLKIGTTLVQKAIEAMLADNADEVVLETEMRNVPALRLYENLGFVRDKRLFRYYLNGVDALRLKLWFR